MQRHSRWLGSVIMYAVHHQNTFNVLLQTSRSFCCEHREHQLLQAFHHVENKCPVAFISHKICPKSTERILTDRWQPLPSTVSARSTWNKPFCAFFNYLVQKGQQNHFAFLFCVRWYVKILRQHGRMTNSRGNDDQYAKSQNARPDLDVPRKYKIWQWRNQSTVFVVYHFQVLSFQSAQQQ